MKNKAEEVVGSRVRLSRDVDLMPYTVLKKGECGTVTYAEADAAGLYSVDVKMDRTHKGLASWDNEAHIVDPELEAVEFQHRVNFLSTDGRRLAIVAIGLLALAFEVWRLFPLPHL
jgi:hypothetical protein